LQHLSEEVSAFLSRNKIMVQVIGQRTTGKKKEVNDRYVIVSCIPTQKRTS
jgi:hypothetical protein